MQISAFPMFVILPVMSNLSVAAYDTNDEQTDGFATPASVLAVHFSLSIGHLIFTATAANFGLLHSSAAVGRLDLLFEHIAIRDVERHPN
jgi:hypothetical protein